MNDIVTYLEELNLVSIFLRIFMAIIFGGIIGYGRERERRPAGLRTHILVSIGSTLAMITNIYMYDAYNLSSDPTRLGAQVISGVGFLGVGTIIVTGKNKVRGLTTAAGLWACSCMGLAIGAGFYAGAIIGCLFIASVTAVLSKLDKKINRNSRNITIYFLVNSTMAVSKLLGEIQNTNVRISDIEISNNNVSSNDLIGVLLGLRIPTDICHNDFIEEIKNKNEVIFMQEIN
ncbi:MgtC/SapB family protein [Clostridium sp.]|uniref:MgtC/SapB family protein n=1 Tax=Clostridium sp. TaxID=1506 RepID=UPI0032203BB8|nr:MgtC/SapB family protein [Clostridium sp.]MCI9302656.1 MgtC/SapB family protein [Clostridium sp.]